MVEDSLMVQGESILTRRTINSLLSEKFFIPDYQRGYRWKKTQVDQLLNDIWTFRETKPRIENNDEKPFYCLQPIVVNSKMVEGIANWEVIDGQQRLTTILIILHYFNQAEFKNPKKIFSLTYQTRKSSEDFLKTIEDAELAKRNIDYLHINEAYKCIGDWFTKKETENEAIRGDFYTSLINEVQVIWYEVNEENIQSEHSSSIDIFTRLNIGKIPLTNSELIKALFLQRSNFNGEGYNLNQIQIATDWDYIEKFMRNESFWLFIYQPSPDTSYENRIEFILDAIAGKKKEDEFYFTFNHFQQKFSSLNKPSVIGSSNQLWLSIKKYFQRLEGWYNNRELYHLIGFLIDCGYSLRKLVDESEKLTKTEFLDFVNSQIKLQVNYQIASLTYKERKDIKKVLLLFNVQTILQTKEADIRFPFYKYKTEEWDIEHVRSQTDKKIKVNERKAWADDILSYFTGAFAGAEQSVAAPIESRERDTENEHDSVESLIARIKVIRDLGNVESDLFDPVYDEVSAHFGEKDATVEVDDISNLALLDSKTNRSYKNAMFPIKRQRIIENDKKGVFVPICTKNLFLKFYSRKMDEVMYWKQSDASDYLEAIKTTLKFYLPAQA